MLSRFLLLGIDFACRFYCFCCFEGQFWKDWVGPGQSFQSFEVGNWFWCQILKRRVCSRSVFSRFWGWELIFIASFEKTGLVPVSLFKVFSLGICFTPVLKGRAWSHFWIFLASFWKDGFVPDQSFQSFWFGNWFSRSFFKKRGWDGLGMVCLFKLSRKIKKLLGQEQLGGYKRGALRVPPIPYTP